jgi:RHS repeat-associated protein
VENVFCLAKPHVGALVLGLWLSLAAATPQAATVSDNAGPAAWAADAAVDPGDDGGGSTTTRVPTFFDQGVLVRSGEVIQPLGPNLMGDTINEFTGSLAFHHTDVALPGNNALRVAVGRQLATGMRQAAPGTGLFGDWDLEIPHLHTVAIHDHPTWYGGNGLGAFNLNRCSQLTEPPTSNYLANNRIVDIPASSWWSGYQLYVPGVGDQTLFKRLSAAVQPTDGIAYPVLTKQHWQLSCLSVLARGSGEGFVARAPDGTRYQFDHMVQRSYPVLDTHRYGKLPRFEIWILPTLVTDRFGNWVRYTYGGADGWQVSAITSSDGRSITFTYNGWGNRIQSVSDGTRTWNYGYDPGGALQTVTQPDGSRWWFFLGDLTRDPFSIEDPGCGSNPYAKWDPNNRVGTLIHPSGASGTFTLKLMMHGRSNVPGSEEACEGPHYINGLSRANLVSRYFANYTLISKGLGGPGMPGMTWTYDYSTARGSFAPCNGCIATKTVTITDPQANVTQKTFGTRFGIDDGLLLASSEGNGNTVLRSTSYAYRAPEAGPYPNMVGFWGGDTNSMERIYTPLSQRTITQQGVAFTQTIDAFDVYARATSLSRTSSLGYSRSESTGYYDHTALWVLGQIGSRTVAGVQAESTTFDASTALPTANYTFGKLESIQTFNGDGTLASVTDGLGHTTTLSDYKRGLPQSILHADGTRISGVVNNIGVLTSVTGEAGTTWTYGYDAMGRLASKTPPGGDATAYYPTTLAFEQVADQEEFGLWVNHWRQTIRTGNAVTINYFDARWRRRVSTTYDATDRAGTERVQRFDYDPYNRVTFESHPQRANGSVGQALPGTAWTYDALGRQTLQTQDSELGVLSTMTEYLGGFTRRKTNARGLMSSEEFQVFDAPTEDAPTRIYAPEGVQVDIARDVWGKPLAITRGGGWSGGTASATRSYVYDAYQRLCKTVEPESGATVQAYDAAGNVAWRASGLNLPGGGCDQGSVPEGRKISHGYDAQNRLTSTSYGDGSPSITRSYTADGLPQQVASAGATWTYQYNNRRLKTQESLAYGGTNYTFGWGIDAYGHGASLSYPGGPVVQYSPDALGRATQASGYASGVSYHPNGAIAGYTLANGVAHSQTQNLRGLPQQWRDAGVVQDLYSYDANANVTAITDQQEGVSSRTMGYDGLDRLTSANGVWGAAGYGYDPLDNLRSSTVGGRSLSHQVEAATNRLTSLSGSQNIGFGYDANGNITARGGQAYSFDIGNRLATAVGKADYSYDGWGRRVRVGYADGQVKVQVYGQDGQLLMSNHSSQGLTRHIYLGRRLIAESNSLAGTSYDHTDALGSPVARTNTNGQILSRTRYEPYGATAAGANPNGIGFTGHVNDADTGLVQMQQRYYDPLAGRFLSVDPVTTDAGTAGHFNRYVYGEDNPYKYLDPDGQQPAIAAAIPPLLIAVGAHYVLPGREAREQSLANLLHAATGAERPSTLVPGANAGESIPARGPGRDFTRGERGQVNGIGNDTGCHTCGAEAPGTTSGNWIPDHQPPSGLNETGGPQRLYPHCQGCSRTQGGQVNGAKARGNSSNQQPSQDGGSTGGTSSNNTDFQGTFRVEGRIDSMRLEKYLK